MTYTALITGSTSGIGKALAEKMAQEGHHLVLVSRDSKKLEHQQHTLQQAFNATVSVIAHDLTKPNAAQTIFSILNQQNTKVNILVNNAGFSESGSFLGAELEKQSQMITLHALFTTQLTQRLLPQIVERQFGRILNLGSIASYLPLPYNAVYAASKAYVLHFSKALQHELKGTGVSSTCLCPGATHTEFAEKSGMQGSLFFKYGVMSAEQVANIGYQAMIQQKTAVIPGIHNKSMVAFTKILPSWLINKFITTVSTTEQTK